MKKFKKGYTLAEVLIVIGIVGIVAAITLPALISNASKQTAGAEVGRAKELLEHATASVINSATKDNEDGYSITTLTGIHVKDVVGGNSEDWLLKNNETEDSNWILTVQGITGLHKHAANYLNSIKMYSGENLLSSVSSYSNLKDYLTFKFDKSKALIIYEPIGEIQLDNARPDSVLTRIFIDTNGSDEPNRVGQDVFLFGLANNGHIVPAGSESYNIGDFVEHINVDSCLDKNNKVDNEIACAAKIAADKWRINY